MSQTVIGLFENKTESDKVLQELTQSGIPRDRVDISQGYAPEKVKADSDRTDKDSVSKFFDSLFGSDDSKRYSYAAQTCGTIVTVHAENKEQAQKAAWILDKAGAEDIDEIARKCGADTADATGAAHQARAGAQAQQTGTTAQHQQQTNANAQQKTTGGAAIPVINENVEVGKREVESGGVRVKSRIVERPVQENLRLREEHVVVDRQKVNRPVIEADMKNFKEGEATFTEHKEVPVVNKEAKVVEEIRIGKEVNERQETIRETEKKTEVDVQKMNSANNPGNNPGNKPNSGR